jgi:hypothetical protein
MRNPAQGNHSSSAILPPLHTLSYGHKVRQLEIRLGLLEFHHPGH